MLSIIALTLLSAVTVAGPDGRPVARASVRVSTLAGTPVATGATDERGEFTADPRPGLVVEIEAEGFAPFRGALTDRIRLELASPRQSLTVTATRSSAEDLYSIAPASASHEVGRLTPLAGHLAGSPSVLLQQTGPSQASPFLRGLTGYQVSNLVDGVRFNNSTFRSGPNQYLAFIEPSQAQRIETVLGPASALYGSDAMGGAIQVFTPLPNPSDGWHGEGNVFGASADWSAGADAGVSHAGKRLSWLAGVSGRRHGDVRAGQGTDSRHVLRRLFDAPDSVIRQVTGSRQQDTGFTQYGLSGKLLARLAERQWLSAWFQQARQDNVRNYKDLWGGLGRLQSDLAPQGLDFAYLRWEALGLAGFDSVQATTSINSQRDGTRRRALRFTDRLTVDTNRVDSVGYAGQAARGPVAFGGDFYDERIYAARVDGGVAARPLYPDDSRYRTGALFAQGQKAFAGNRLRASAGGRWTRVGYSTKSDARFGVTTTRQTFSDATFNTSLLWQATSAFGVHALVGRGFRAPNANDLGAVGLNDLGFEIPASEAPAGALLGNSAGEGATSLGRSVAGLKAERLFNYEAGFRITTRRFRARAQFFRAQLYDPIVRRTLLYPANAVPAGFTAIAPTAAQRAQGVVTVATPVDPRAVKAFVNDGQSRYEGVDAQAWMQLAPRWSMEATYSYIAGRDLLPNRNIRRLPPQQGLMRLRYARSRYWAESWLMAAGAQRRLSGGDLDDERIGASRTLAAIESFFLGSRIQPFIESGRFTPTGETLAQIQRRVTPGPLYRSTAGWATLNAAAGAALTERLDLTVAATNLADKNYRVHGSGFDAPGVNISMSLRFRF